MSGPFRVIPILLLFSVITLSVHAQAPTKALKKGTIAGKVTIKSKPAVGITVGVRASDFGSPFEPTYKAVTDLQGLYRVTDVPPGNYRVSTLAPSYVQPDEGRGGKTVVLSEGETVEGMDFSLTRGGVVTGKVTDADGRPVIEQRVNLIQADLPPEQRRRAGSVSGVETDDRGIYRMFGLYPGRYKVSVGQGQDNFSNSVSAGRPSYKETYHPDVNDYAKATVIEVTEGSESNNVDIALGRVAQSFSASGQAINGETKQPAGNLRFGLRLFVEQGVSFTSSQAISNSEGKFIVENLMPGKYALFILPQANNPLRADAVTFEIVDQDVKDLVITTSKGISVSGVVVLENTSDQSIFARLMQLRLQGVVQGETPGGNIGHLATIQNDGSFRFDGLEAGNLYISVGALMGDRSASKSFNLVRTERDGVVQPRAFEIKKGEQVTGIRLVIAYGSGTVRGEVKLENGALPAGGHVSLRLTKPGDTNTILRAPILDARGRFLLDGLPVGDYEIGAYVFLPGARTGPLTAKQHITISNEATIDVLLTIDLAQKPAP